MAGLRGATVMLQPYPAAASLPDDATAEAELAWVQGFVLGIRQIRGEMDIAPSQTAAGAATGRQCRGPAAS